MKIGDWVVCLRAPRGWMTVLVVGDVYKISAISSLVYGNLDLAIQVEGGAWYHMCDFAPVDGSTKDACRDWDKAERLIREANSWKTIAN